MRVKLTFQAEERAHERFPDPWDELLARSQERRRVLTTQSGRVQRLGERRH